MGRILLIRRPSVICAKRMEESHVGKLTTMDTHSAVMKMKLVLGLVVERKSTARMMQ